MIVDCLACTHGHFPQLEGGDLLIVAGDVGARDEREEYVRFFKWLMLQNYRKIILIAGNHDNWLTQLYRIPNEDTNLEYLCDSGTEFVYYPPLDSVPAGTVLERQKLKIWGSPWTLRFPGENPRCLAFTCETEEELAEHFAKILEDTDILVTHSPPYAMLDQVVGKPFPHNMVGSKSLEMRVHVLPKLKANIFGHVHEAYGMCSEFGITYVNASRVNERYEPVNKPIRIEL